LSQLQQYEDELHERVLLVDDTLGMQTVAFAFFHTHKKEITDALETIKKESHLIGKPERVENFLFKIDH
jgi:hypothetical protein